MSAGAIAGGPEGVAGGWQAQLDLRFGVDGARRTRVVHKRHVGPLRLLKAHPYPDGACEAVIVHPPGGLVGGDQLALHLELEPGARVVCTTPGAQKWYRTEGAAAQAQTLLQVGAGAALEWLPQPAIVFDRAQVVQQLTMRLAADARLLGWECLVLGRSAMGERFTQGGLRQKLSIEREGRVLWCEHTVAQAGDRLFESALGWAQRSVACSVWMVVPEATVAETMRDTCRAIVSAATQTASAQHARLAAGVSAVAPGVVLACILADDAEPVMALAQQIWRAARAEGVGGQALMPRIWST